MLYHITAVFLVSNINRLGEAVLGTVQAVLPFGKGEVKEVGAGVRLLGVGGRFLAHLWSCHVHGFEL